MNFFERQHVARRNSRVLLLLFLAAVAATVVALDFVGSNAWVLVRLYNGHHTQHVPASVHAAIAGATLLAILAVSLAKVLELRAGGGTAVARMMGARGIARASENPFERRLFNVVEEMAIASGVRVPQVFVMDSQGGINAFTAGHDVSHAVIVVTRGALETLTRDELQGIVAHEFSHIVNGDMALNMRMIGVLAGIVWIGAAGKFVMRAAARAEDARALPVAFLGLLVYLVGAIGLAFSRLIKAVLLREREYLADAGSVQFTRNAEGLAGALDRVRATYSWVSHRHCEDVSHLFFADADGFLSEPFFATHPPIDKRIERIAPDFRPADYRVRREAAMTAAAQAAERARRERLDEKTRLTEVPWRFSPAQAVALVGSVQAQHVEEARRSLRSLPPELRAALDRTPQACGVVLALFLARDEAAAAEAAFASLEAAGLAALANATRAAMPLVTAIAADNQLAVVDLALPALKAQAEAERTQLVRALEAMLAMDDRISVYGFAFATFVRSQLEAARSPAPARYRSLVQLRDDAAVLVSLVAHAGCAQAATIDRDFVRAFEAGAVESGLVGQAAARRREECTPQAVSRALERLRDLAPLEKARLVKGLFAAVTADGVIRTVEAALMRMIGSVLDCPLPPLMTGDDAIHGFAAATSPCVPEANAA